MHKKHAQFNCVEAQPKALRHRPLEITGRVGAKGRDRAAASAPLETAGVQQVDATLRLITKMRP